MTNPAPVGQLEDQLRHMILSNTATPQDRDQASGPNRNNQTRGNRGQRAQHGPFGGYHRNTHSHAHPQQNAANSLQSWNETSGIGQQQQPRNHHPQQQFNTSQPRVLTHNNRLNGSLRSDDGSIQHPMPRGDMSARGAPGRGGPGRDNFRSMPSKFTPLVRPSHDQFSSQCQYLEQIAAERLPQLEMSEGEFASKDRFRIRLEQACQQAAVNVFTSQAPDVRLASFGSLSSGFAMPGSDMDLALVTSHLTAELPRLFEKALLNMGCGARLLTRTRVPIIKVCESPSAELYAALLEERQKWESMTPQEQLRYDQTGSKEEEAKEEIKETVRAEVEAEPEQGIANDESQRDSVKKPRRHRQPPKTNEDSQKSNTSQDLQKTTQSAATVQQPIQASTEETQTDAPREPRPPRPPRPWFREKHLGPLDFPKSGVGIQCDINFSNPLGLHNTLLLRCYSHCDVRVRLMVLVIKSWASRRKVNSGYNGTLSSYGYVLMVLHYLVNVVHPPVCPNLQLTRRSNVLLDALARDPNAVCEGYDVRFWRNEVEILNLAAKGMLSHNQQPLGVLLRGFFQYYAQQGFDSPGGGFMWTQQVLSLRTQGGLLSKEAKGWTGAKTTMQDSKEIRHRYLFAIEDPFEIDHNVARTVTHNGIVAIRDEFRRAWRLIIQAGRGNARPGNVGIGHPMHEGELFDLVQDVAPPKATDDEGKTGGGQGDESTGAEAVRSEIPSAAVSTG